MSIDLETSPNLAHVWGIWQQNVGLNQLLATTEMLSFAAKWYGTPRSEIMFFSKYHHGQEAMVQAAWDLLNEAEAVMHFNGRAFDIKHLNREFVTHGFTPPSPYQQIDLLKVVQKRFKFPSNKLAYVSKVLGCKGKLDTGGHELWVRCMAGDAKAWKIMQKYNEQDVYLLEELHDKLRAWIPAYPTADAHDAPGVCVAAGCKGKLKKDGFYRTARGRYQQFQCTKCGKWSRSPKSESLTELQEAVL